MKKFGIALILIVPLFGCGNEGASTPSKRTPITLPAGQEVSLMLLTPLESGGSKVGDKATFIVASDVMVDGQIAVPEGTQVQALVTTSRGAGALSSMLNEPARLTVEFQPINLGSSTVAMANPENRDTATYAFTRENTGAPANPIISQALKDDEKKAALSALANLVEEASVEGGRIDDERLRQIVDELDLKRVRSMLDSSNSAESKSDQIAGMIRALRTGAALSTGDIGLALGAIEELGGVAGEVTGTLKGIFKGRNIRAHVGTRVTMVVASEVMIQ